MQRVRDTVYAEEALTETRRCVRVLLLGAKPRALKSAKNVIFSAISNVQNFKAD
ncbi:hypothetical protein Plhal304r1_c006g0026161 [Plasmopara halstedii]